MKKLKFLFFPTILALAFGLMLSCAKSSSDDSSSSADTSAVTVIGKVQKGPYVQGTEITVRELDSSMTPTGNTFTGSIDDNTGSFSIKGTLANKIAELAADGYYFNEVSGSLSTAKLALQAFSDLTDSSSVNVNLMTHLEKKRVEYLMDNSKMTFAAAKTQAQTEIMKIFNIDNVTLGNSETLDISKSGDGNAVLLAISAILQSDKTEAELTELLSTINTDIRTDGTLDSTNTKATLVTAMEYVKLLQSTIRSNIETRYNTLGLSVSIPSFETYILKLDTTAPTVASTSHADNTTKIAVNLPITATFSDYLDNSTVTSTNFFLKDNSSNLITTSVTYLDNKSATLTPSSNLSEIATYTATLKTGIKDLAGHALESDYSWSFTTGDFTAPIVAEVTTVTSLTIDNTPSYTFSSTEAGTITYGGSCSSSTTTATSGKNTIDLSVLSLGNYDNCTITVTDSAGNAGNTIKLTSFTIGVSDVDNNTYFTVIIGTQVWMAENLNTSKYRDETEIPEEQDGDSDGVDAGSDYWSGLTTGAWSYYNNDSANGAVYGKLYNWYAVNGDVDGDGTKDKELCLQGWHVPSSSEFTTLINYLGGSNSAATSLKNGGNSGFNAISSPFRYGCGGDSCNNGGFGSNSYYDRSFWASTESNSSSGEYLRIETADTPATSLVINNNKKGGKSVRCIMD